MGYEKMEKIRINRKSYIEWFYNKELNHYRVTAKIYNREIYNKVLDEKHYKIFHNFINERIKYLIGEEIIDKEYVMILLDNTMYKVVDSFHFMELMRFMIPVDSIEEYHIKDNIFDIVLDCSLRTGEVFGETDLVFHNGAFYNNGKRIKDIRDFDRVGIEYNEWDLMNGITKEQLDFIVSDYYSRDFERYITKDISINIDKWY